MFIRRKSEFIRSQWPFQPWPARLSSAMVGWSDVAPGRVRVHLPLWELSLLMVGIVSVIMSAGVAIAQLHADDDAGNASPAVGQCSRGAGDGRLEALLSEHRRVVRGY
jgi:hypothetical protein